MFLKTFDTLADSLKAVRGEPGADPSPDARRDSGDVARVHCTSSAGKPADTTSMDSESFRSLKVGVIAGGGSASPAASGCHVPPTWFRLVISPGASFAVCTTSACQDCYLSSLPGLQRYSSNAWSMPPKCHRKATRKQAIKPNWISYLEGRGLPPTCPVKTPALHCRILDYADPWKFYSV